MPLPSPALYPSADLYPASVGLTSIRELPPLRLHTQITTPAGQHTRWAMDEPKAQNIPSGLRFSSIVPGGFESSDATLPRKTNTGYGDLDRLSDVSIFGAGGETAWEGRLERAPRTSGDSVSIAPSSVGWQANLSDDASASEVYVDRNLGNWVGMSNPRRVALGAGTIVYDASTDTSQATPAERLAMTGAFSASPVKVCEAWYDSMSKVGAIYADWSTTDSNSSFSLVGQTADDDNATGDTNVQADVLTGSASGSTGYITPATARRWFYWRYSNASSYGSAIEYSVNLKNLVVYGNHGLTRYGTEPDAGLLASDIIADIVSRFTTLNHTPETIKPSAFVVPQLEFRDLTTAAEMITQANRFELRDWAVWEGRTFFYRARGEGGRAWRARVGPAQLSETGPQVDRLWNGVVVRYADEAGTTRTVGPPGASTDATDASLLDTDPLNPVNEWGLRRYAIVDAGTSTQAGATQIGFLFLTWSKELDSSGSAQLVGYVEDDRGIIRPAWQVRAGDTISFVDASDPSPRRIVHAEHDYDSRTTSIDLDAPPEAMAALLERLGVVLVKLGLT